MRSFLKNIGPLVFLGVLFIGCQDVDFRGRLARAEKLAEEERFVDAYKAFKALSKESTDPKVSQAAQFRGALILWQHLKQPEQARDELKSVLQSTVDKQDAYEIRAVLAELLFSRLEDYRSAIEELKVLVESRRENQELYKFRLAKCYFFLGEFQTSSELFKNLYLEAQKKEIKSSALFEWGSSLSSAGKFHEAIEVYEKIEGEYPGTLLAEQSTLAIANSYESLQDIRKAMAVYQSLRPSPMVTARLELLATRLKSAPPEGRDRRDLKTIDSSTPRLKSKPQIRSPKDRPNGS